MDKPWIANYEPGVPASLTYPPMTLAQLAREATNKYASHTAAKFVLSYIVGHRLAVGGKMSYRQLGAAIENFAGSLYDLGVRKGDRVGVMLPNTPQYVVAFFGALRIGATVVNFNPTYTAPEIEHQLQDSGAETLVTYNAAYPKFKSIQNKTPTKRAIVTYIHEGARFPYSFLVKSKLRKQADWVDVSFGPGVYSMKDMLKGGKRAPQVDTSPDDVALFQYTGGTTGLPKAAMLSHHNIIANVLQVRAWLPRCEDGNEKLLAAIPFFHVYGMTVGMIFSLYMGGQMIITPDPRNIELLMRIIQREGVTLFPGVPAMYSAVINHKNVAQYNLRSVKACISGSAPLPMVVQEKFGELTGGRLVEGYGLTEAAPVTHCNPVFGKRKEGSIGVPFPDVEAKIVNVDSGQDVPVGEPGELWVRGPQVMLGYWQKPEESAKTVTPDGWLQTGDIAVMDEEGYFKIVDRKKDLIIVGGFNVYPRDVEEVLMQHPKVQEAVVAGVPSVKAGDERVKAYVVLKAGQTATEEELKSFCEQSLVYYKVPKFIEFRSELPKSQVGKFLRRVLVEEEKARMAVPQ